jgi:FkbM family methyltransferase
MPTTQLHGLSISYNHSDEFHWLKNEIFTNHTYYWELPTLTPRILDLGAHIGLTTLYFKKFYPEARVTAVEPHPESVEILKMNLDQNNFFDVDIQQVALGPQPGSVELWGEEDWPNTSSSFPGGWADRETQAIATVPVITLSSLLNEPIDLVKMDIEGQELKCLPEAAKVLTQAQRWIVEYHPLPGSKVEDIVELFETHGFKTEVFEPDKTHRQVSGRGLRQVRAWLDTAK